MNGNTEDAKKMLKTRIGCYKIEIAVLKTIKSAIAKWDNKVLNKRFATALTKECSSLPWRVEFFIYKSSCTRGVQFWYSDNRNYRQSCYVTKRADELVTVDPNTFNERINASAWIDSVNALIDWANRQAAKLQAESDNMDNLIARYNQLLQAYKDFRYSLSGDFIDIMEKNYIFNRR